LLYFWLAGRDVGWRGAVDAGSAWRVAGFGERFGCAGVGGDAGADRVVAVRARILAATRQSPPVETGLSHWSSREMAAFILPTDGVYVSHHYVAKLWRDNKLRPHRQGNIKKLVDNNAK
jgi:hypothetical protein